MIRQKTAGNTCYDKQKDLEYTISILVTVLMCCGCTDLDPANYTIDEVVSLIKEMYFIDSSIVHDASNDIVGNARDHLLTNYRRFWFNYQLIMAVN